MAFLSKDAGGTGGFEPVPAGTYVARCITVVDIGIQQSNFGPKEKVWLGFEIPSVRVSWTKRNDQGVEIEHEGPALIGSTYTNSIHRKAILGQHLVSWRGKDFTDKERDGFELFNVLGAPCMISVTHNIKGDKTYANITAIMRLPQGTTAPDAETDIIGYSPSDNTKIGNLTKLPEWLQKRCHEGHGAAADYPVSDLPKDDEFDDDIPF